MGCVACGGPLAFFGPRRGYEYHRCESCGSIQLHPLPDQAEILRAYATQYSRAGQYHEDPDFCTPSFRTYYRSIVTVLRDYGISGLVVDYGASWGGLTQMLLENKFKCLGLEISEEMAAHCRARGLPVRHGDLSAFGNGDRTSALVLCTVFEHFVDHDAWLARASDVLENGGLLVSLQPTATFANFVGRVVRLGSKRLPLPPLDTIFFPPWHTVLFSVEGMRRLMERNGFELVEVRPAPQGRLRGVKGAVQICLESVNRIGWHLAATRWPLLTAHTFVAQKTGRSRVSRPGETGAAGSNSTLPKAET